MTDLKEKIASEYYDRINSIVKKHYQWESGTKASNATTELSEFAADLIIEERKPKWEAISPDKMIWKSPHGEFSIESNSFDFILLLEGVSIASATLPETLKIRAENYGKPEPDYLLQQVGILEHELAKLKKATTALLALMVNVDEDGMMLDDLATITTVMSNARELLKPIETISQNPT